MIATIDIQDKEEIAISADYGKAALTEDEIRNHFQGTFSEE